MPRRNPLLLLAISALVLACPASCADPVLLPMAKDAATSLYTIPVRDGANHVHVIDLAGPLLWSTCDHIPANIPCQDPVCKLANAYRAPSCGIAGQPCSKRCKAYPYNPITGRCAAAELVHTRLVANTTDGKNPLSQVSVRAVAACAPRTLLERLPRDVTGVAGLSAAGLALPAQVAASQRVANTFLLCLPRSGRGDGVAIFGSRGPFYLKLFLTGEPSSGDLTQTLQFTPLRSRPGNPLYYIPVTNVAINRAQVPLPPHALSTGGVVLCTRVPYTALRPDVYRPVVEAFDRGLIRSDMRVAAVPPFEFCYNRTLLPPTRLGYGVPEITLALEGGKEWTFVGSSSMVDVNAKTACLAFVEMKGVKAGDPAAAAVVVGGFQMEDHLLQFDLEKKQLGFAKVPIISACSNFNFTRGQ
ncbi:unnamed protein product [Miscanthus lutarioriparius]|uniref:Peptidase A1 domain-containing protein n=1 Tax=Miscanthus lutarioriparius TaxID=422564 RepID=A0A811P6A4_9POAL|nr:unnamed protein product [Miscanthus lutarioriparius]